MKTAIMAAAAFSAAFLGAVFGAAAVGVYMMGDLD